jgi:transposase
MLTTAPHNEPGTTPERVVFLAFALSEKTWQLGFTPGPGQQPRARGGTARHQARVLPEVAQANQRLGLPDTAPVVRCDAAGREGFGRHRFVQAQGSTHHGVESSAMEVKRRQRRAKSGGVALRQWFSMLRRLHHGARAVWRVVPGPAVAAADQRHLHRALERLKQARASTTARIQGLLRSPGRRLPTLHKVPEHLDALRLWEGAPLPRGLRPRFLRG